MEQEFIKIKRSVRNLRIYAGLLTLILIAILSWSILKDTSTSGGVIRVKGIIVEDASGRERILIGAPIPFADNRLRTDTNRVKEQWGRLFPPQYMSWYKNYSHETNGIVILDSLGFDRLAFGDPTPDPNIGKRIGPATGMVINDERGFERSGYGLLEVDGKNRVVLGLDRENGTEGVSLVVFEDGTSGLIMSSPDQRLFIGKADTVNWFTPDRYPFNGIFLWDREGQEIIFNSSEKK